MAKNWNEQMDKQNLKYSETTLTYADVKDNAKLKKMYWEYLSYLYPQRLSH